MDESMGAMLQRTQPQFVKEIADVFVSYAWAYLVGDMVTALETLLNDIPEENDLFIWMDSLIMNQHKAERKEYDTEFWSKTFHSTINKIGHVAVIMTPWDSPYNLTRSWCLWEMYGTTLDPNTVIVPSQQDAFRQALNEDVLNLVARIGKIDVANAEAFNKDDQEMILKAAQTAKQVIHSGDARNKHFRATSRHQILTPYSHLSLFTHKSLPLPPPTHHSPIWTRLSLISPRLFYFTPALLSTLLHLSLHSPRNPSFGNLLKPPIVGISH